jgi:hypothetical protein
MWLLMSQRASKYSPVSSRPSEPGFARVAKSRDPVHTASSKSGGSLFTGSRLGASPVGSLGRDDNQM